MAVKKTLSILLICTFLLSLPYFWLDTETTPLNDQERTSLAAPFVELQHGFVHYEDKGPEEAPLVVLVHGFSIPSYVWDKNVDFLINEGFRVLRFDLYGRGWSNRPRIDYSLDLFVNQLNELINQRNIKRSFHLVGLSMGGAIATRYAAEHRERVASLSLLAPLVDTPSRPELELLALPGLGEYLAAVVMMPQLKNKLAETVYDVASYPEWSDKLAQHIHYQGYRHALLSTARYLKGKSFIEDYRKLGQTTIPTQLIWGRQDQVVPFSDSQKVLAVAPTIALHALDPSGHLPQIEQTDLVNQLLLKHFSK